MERDQVLFLTLILRWFGPWRAPASSVFSLVGRGRKNHANKQTRVDLALIAFHKSDGSASWTIPSSSEKSSQIRP